MSPVVSRRFLTRLHGLNRNHIDFAYWLIRQMDTRGIVSATPTEMAQALGLPQQVVLRALETLERCGLVALDAPGYRISPADAFTA